jgi:hypothetical protein
METENGWSNTESLNFYALLAHESIPLVLDNVFGILVCCDIIWTDKEIKEFKWLKECIDR